MNISLNKELADIVNKEVKAKKFANRSEFFRNLIRKYCVNPKEAKKKSERAKIIAENYDYYKMLDYTMRDWEDPENDDIFKIE